MLVAGPVAFVIGLLFTEGLGLIYLAVVFSFLSLPALIVVIVGLAQRSAASRR